MFRICKAELKKIFLRPSIFVVTGLLIFVLAISSFLYHPSNRDSRFISIPSTYNSISACYNYFSGSATNESFAKYNEKLYLAESKLLDYYLQGENYVEYLLSLIGTEQATDPSTLVGAYNEFVQASFNYHTNTGNDVLYNILIQKRNNFKQVFVNFRNTYESNVESNADQEQKKVLSTVLLNSNVRTFLGKCIATFDKQGTEDLDLYIIEQLGNQLKFRQTLTNYINQLIPYSPNTEYIESLQPIIATAISRLKLEKGYDGRYYNVKDITDNELRNKSFEELDNLYDQIRWYNIKYGVGDTNTSKEHLENFKLLLTKYKLTVVYAYDLIRNGIDLNVVTNYSNQHINGFQGYEKYNFYNSQEEQVKLQYLYNTNTYEFDYANTFSIAQTSNYSADCFDFAYFAMSLCMIVIITYVVVIASTTIIGELSSGTMKMLAIRPFNRNKILAGKLLATLLIGTIIIAISSLATFFMGLVLYGFNATMVLSIFNASTAIVISPIFLFIVFIISMLMEMTFFVLLALAISLIFKSQIVSIAISILAYVGTLVLNTLNASILKFLPFTNINIFKYFGASFLSTEGGLIESALNSSIVMGADFLFTIIIYLLTTIALTVVSFVLFKNRDIK